MGLYGWSRSGAGREVSAINCLSLTRDDGESRSCQAGGDVGEDDRGVRGYG